MDILFKLYIVILNICFGCSLISFKLHFPLHMRLFALLLGLTVVTEFMAQMWLHYFHFKTNYAVYDIYMLLEYGVYSFFFRMIIQRWWMRQVIFGFMVVLPIFWIITTFFVFGFSRNWNSYMVLFGDAFSIAMAVGYFYEVIVSDQLIDIKHTPEFWISVGILIFSCCEIPVTGILNFLESQYTPLVLWLLTALQILNILMYGIFIYAYLCPEEINMKN